MIDTKTKFVYKAFGLIVNSEIYLPELPKLENKVESADLEIKFQDLTELWNKLSHIKREFIIHQNEVIFQVPTIATFRIQDGNKILISPLEKFDEDVVRLYLLGTCMSTILMQRKIYPLHGSCLAIEGKAYAIVGESGAGKSTLATAFLREGYQLLSDDVIAVSVSKEHPKPIAAPSYPCQKLWQDSLDNFGVDFNKYRSIYGRETKYAVPVYTNYFPNPLPLSGIFELVKSNEKGVKFSKVEKLDRFSTLFSHTFRNFLIQDLGLMEWHFHTTAKILQTLEVYSIKRPVHEFSADKLVSMILNIINKGGAHND
jgi:hypothetical protein